MRTILLTVCPVGFPPVPEGAVALFERVNDLVVVGPQPVYPWVHVQPPAEDAKDLVEALGVPWLECVKVFAGLRFGAAEIEAEFHAEISSCPRSLSQRVTASSSGVFVGLAVAFLGEVRALLRGN